MTLAFLFVIVHLVFSACAALVFFQIAVGIWLPRHATSKQLAWAAHPAVSLTYPAMKWLSPILAVTMLLSISLGLIRLAALLARGS